MQAGRVERRHLSAFMMLDGDKKMLSSATIGEPSRTEDIEGVSVMDKAISLYGTQGKDTWSEHLT
jgi:hypothetical protein